MQGDAHDFGGVLHPAGHGDVRLGRCRIAGWVIVHQNERGGVQFQCAFDHFAGVYGDVVHGSGRLFLVRDQGVFRIEVKDPKLLGGAMGHGGVAVVDERPPMS